MGQNYRSIRAFQIEAGKSSKSYIAPLEIPVFSWGKVTGGLATPGWTPPYDILITDAVISSPDSTAGLGGSTTVWILKKNFFSDPDATFIGSISLAGSTFSNSRDFTSDFTSEKVIGPYDSVYCQIQTTSGVHTTLSVTLYGERYRQL